MKVLLLGLTNERRSSPWLVIRGIAFALAAIGLRTLIAPSTVSAHERWFTLDGPYSAPTWCLLLSWPVALALLIGSGTVVILALAQRWLGDPLWPRPPILQRMETSAAAILGVQTAITMIFMASRLDLFVPNIKLPHSASGLLIAAITIVAAFSFITGVLTRWGAMITLCLVVTALAFAPWYAVLEQVLFVGIALYLVAVGRGVMRYGDVVEDHRSVWADRLRPYALPVLRITAGISVLVVAFTEKLIDPALGVTFLETHERFNVAREAGLTWFTDERFVFAVGIIEATAGLALLSGFLPRVVVLALWIPFNLGIAFLPAEELIGHLPILSTMYVLLVRGTQGIPPPSAQRTTRTPLLRPEASQSPVAPAVPGTATSRS